MKAAADPVVADPAGPPGGGGDLPRPLRFLRPLVDAVAGWPARVHTKLLVGFLTSAVLLLGMGVVSLLAQHSMSQRVATIDRAQHKLDLAQDMKYAVTAQMHYRAMTLLTRQNSYLTEIADAKATFARDLRTEQHISPATEQAFYRQVAAAEARFDAASALVLAHYRAGDIAGATRLHLSDEHPLSHVLEAQMRHLQATALSQINRARASYDATRRTLTAVVATFCAVSLLLALLLGFVFSWAFIRPVRAVAGALTQLAGGQSPGLLRVANRDEFGELARDAHGTGVRLAGLYAELRGLNTDLQDRVDRQVHELERAHSLRRYLSPQLADSILAGDFDIHAASRRRRLTVFFSDLRGFTALSERIEPEELVDMLNRYLAAMTEIVFRHGGTLDKYIGDAIMVFFGDPLPFEDHAEPAVAMAMEMQSLLAAEFGRQAGEPLGAGMGISTGYVTVGNIGSSARMDYTVLGNHVNLAARLAAAAAAGQILVTERTFDAVRHLVEATELPPTRLAGVFRQTAIYQVLQARPTTVAGTPARASVAGGDRGISRPGAPTRE